MLNIHDNLESKGAADLARTIHDFWFARGYEGIETRIEAESISGHSASVWVVRSNMRNGVPPRWKNGSLGASRH